MTPVRHSYDVQIAQGISINAALIIEYIAAQCDANAANKTDGAYHYGQWWMRCTIGEFNAVYPELTDRMIRGAISKLKEAELIFVDNFNIPSRYRHYDRTHWYTLSQKGRDLMQGEAE